VVEPVGVGGQRGGLGQRGQSGEQPGPDVGGQVVDVGDPADADQLEGEQAQQVVGGRDHRGARVAGGGGQGGQVQGDQLGHGQQQPGDRGVGPLGQGGEVEHLRTPGMIAERGAALTLGAEGQPGKPGLGEHLRDAGAVQRGRRAGQCLGDLGGRVPGPAQLDDLLPGGVLGRCPGRPRTGVEEEPALAGPEVAHRRTQRRRRVPGPRSSVGDRHPLIQVTTQRLVAAMVRTGGPGEELPAGTSRHRPTRGRFRCPRHGNSASAGQPIGNNRGRACLTYLSFLAFGASRHRPAVGFTRFTARD